MASFLRAFCNQIGGYPVSLSSIGALQQICEAFSSSNVAKTHKTSFCDVFLAQNLFLFDLEWSILLFCTFYNTIAVYSVSLSSIGAIQRVCEAFSSSIVAKTPKNMFLRRCLAQNLLFFKQSGLFYYLPTFCNQIGGYPVSLGSIGALQQFCEAFSSSNVAKTPKNTFFCDVVWPRTYFFLI